MVTFLGIIISGLLAYIAYQNYKISKAAFYIQRDKLRLDLFDRRYKVFRALQEVLTPFLAKANFTRNELFKFSNDSSDVGFLFGPDIENYINEMNQKILKLIHLNERLENQPAGTEERTEITQEMADLEIWFMDQIQNSKKIFRKYLHFSIDKNP
jgi:hypothetical protein